MTPTNHDRLSISPFRVDSLAAASPEAPDWLWRGYLAPGQLTLLTSLWKSGKTTLLSVLLARMKGGGDLLGMTVRPTRVLILSEENRNLWAMRQQRLDIGGHAQVICQPFGGKKPADADWRSLLDQSAGLLGTEGSRLLVIDTVATLMPTGVETNADCMVRALAPLRGLAAQGIAIWLMHHPHKGKPRAGQWSRGSGSLPSSVDVALEMHLWCPDDIFDRRRLLLGWWRHHENTRRQLIEWTADGTGYLVLDETVDPAFERAWSTIRRVLSDFEDPQTAEAILRDWPPDSPPPSHATLHRWLTRAVDLRWLCQEPSTRRNEPHHYWLPEAEQE